MAWLIQHKCNPGDAEFHEYAILRGQSHGQPLTRILCPGCREEFYILGHEMFNEAIHEGGEGSGLPPGFVIPHLRRV